MKSPILLTERDKPNSNALNELKRLGVQKVFIVGGTGVISAEVENEINNLNIEVERISEKADMKHQLKLAKKDRCRKWRFCCLWFKLADALSIGTYYVPNFKCQYY